VAPLLLGAGTCCTARLQQRRDVQQLIDFSCPTGAQQQTHRTPLLLSIYGTDRRTDRCSTLRGQ